MAEIERRAAFDLRASGSQITGYAAVFNSPSHDLGGFTETIRPGAFARSLAEGADVVALYHHDARAVLGRTLSRTLQLSEDARGLRFTLDVANTSAGRDVLESVGRGDVTGASFGFRARKDEWNRNTGGAPVRTLLDVDLFDVTITATPAYPEASVARRTLQATGAGAAAARLRLIEIKRRRISA